MQAVRDQSLAEEKEAEAAGLEASVPVYEAGSVSAEAAAAKSLALSLGASSRGCHARAVLWLSDFPQKLGKGGIAKGFLHKIVRN